MGFTGCHILPCLTMEACRICAWWKPAEIITGLVLVSSFCGKILQVSGCGVRAHNLRFFHGVCSGASIVSDKPAPLSQSHQELVLPRAPFPTKAAGSLQAGCSSVVSCRLCIRFGCLCSAQSSHTIPQQIWMLSPQYLRHSQRKLAVKQQIRGCRGTIP